MKKTLFAMAALALCGTAFAQNEDRNVVEGGDYALEDGDTLHVDVTASVSGIYAETEAATVTFKFYGLNTITWSDYIILSLTTTPCVITGDVAAINHWVSELTSDTGEVKCVTLMDTDYMECHSDTGIFFSFDGNSSQTQITLGNAMVDFMGSFHGLGKADAMSHITGDNQIALVSTGDGTSGSLFLVGKITPAVPEPATATLSLLALAGLASRRRRK